MANLQNVTGLKRIFTANIVNGRLRVPQPMSIDDIKMGLQDQPLHWFALDDDVHRAFMGLLFLEGVDTREAIYLEPNRSREFTLPNKSSEYFAFTFDPVYAVMAKNYTENYTQRVFSMIIARNLYKDALESTNQLMYFPRESKVKGNFRI